MEVIYIYCISDLHACMHIYFYNFRETGKILDDLSELAIGIGDELDRQNEYIPELTEQATKTSNDIEAATAHLKKCTPV